MSRRILKFRISLEEETLVQTRRHMERIDNMKIGLQNKEPHIWIEHDDAQTKCEYSFIVVGTGHEIPPLYHYIGSYFQGEYVWHVCYKFMGYLE